MTNHPNRKSDHPSRNPTPAEVMAAREAAGLTQTEAAALIHCHLRSWQEWEWGGRRCHPAFWELFRIKAKKLTAARAVEKGSAAGDVGAEEPPPDVS